MSISVSGGPVLFSRPKESFSEEVQDALVATLSPRVAHTRTEEACLSEGDRQEPGEATLESLVHEANLILDRFASLNFRMDEGLGEAVIDVRECDSHRFIRHVPCGALQELSKKMLDVKGLLSDTGNDVPVGHVLT